MRSLIGNCTICLALAGIVAVRVADAHDTTPWDGSYIGFNFGDSSSSTCNIWALDGGTVNSTNASQAGSRDCSRTGALVGGLQIGKNFQYKRFVWGVGVDLDYGTPRRAMIRSITAARPFLKVNTAFQLEMLPVSSRSLALGLDMPRIHGWLT
jgi:hypothetical protein